MMETMIWDGVGVYFQMKGEAQKWSIIAPPFYPEVLSIQNESNNGLSNVNSPSVMSLIKSSVQSEKTPMI